MITLTYDDPEMEVAMARRLKRDALRPIPPDYKENPSKTMAHQLANYFEQVIWAEAVKRTEYVNPADWQKPKLALKATGDLEKNQAEALAFIQGFLPPKPCNML
jgi:hypothetical protein